MRATFVELPPFQRVRAEYFDDETFRNFQIALMKNPEAGDVIKGAGGLRKIRYADERRSKGKRGGLRVIYYWKDANNQFWLFTVYDKDEADDLTPDQCRLLKQRLNLEMNARRTRQ